VSTKRERERKNERERKKEHRHRGKYDDDMDPIRVNYAYEERRAQKKFFEMRLKLYKS
jgi:hypothetical protein